MRTVWPWCGQSEGKLRACSPKLVAAVPSFDVARARSRHPWRCAARRGSAQQHPCGGQCLIKDPAHGQHVAHDCDAERLLASIHSMPYEFVVQCSRLRADTLSVSSSRLSPAAMSTRARRTRLTATLASIASALARIRTDGPRWGRTGHQEPDRSVRKRRVIKRWAPVGSLRTCFDTTPESYR